MAVVRSIRRAWVVSTGSRDHRMTLMPAGASSYYSYMKRIGVRTPRRAKQVTITVETNRRGRWRLWRHGRSAGGQLVPARYKSMNDYGYVYGRIPYASFCYLPSRFPRGCRVNIKIVKVN